MKMKILISLVLFTGLLVGCITHIPSSTCGAFISPEQCEHSRNNYVAWVTQSCSDGGLVKEVENRLKINNPDALPGARLVCQLVAKGASPDDLFYINIASDKCSYIEKGKFDRGKVERFIQSILGWTTKVDDLSQETMEKNRSICNDFRNNRITARDVLYKEAKLFRDFEREGRSTLLTEMWHNLTWPFKAILGLLSIIATVIGILIGLKKLFGLKDSN